MKSFMDKDFVLKNPTAITLYENYAKDMPIFDFHCHLSVEEIYNDKKFSSITECWLGGDHYKWRLMREMGVDESYITGDKSDLDKFMKYAEVMPYAIGNPIFHWTHMELRRYFDIEDILSPKTAKDIFDKCNEKLTTLTARKMISMSGVKKLFTTDDPIDDLHFHKLLAEDDSFDVEVYPAFRPDKAINIELPTFVPYIAKLADAADVRIDDIDSLCKALTNRIEFFDKAGCVCSDHALDVVMYKPADKAKVDKILKKALNGDDLTYDEIEQYKGYILVHLGKQYSRLGWVQQYHIGALRNNSRRYMSLLGPDTGFDAIEDQTFAKKLSLLLDELDSTDELPKTILYCLNPRDNEVLATIMNCFQQGGVVGKMQFGSAWWFNDQKDGMEKQLTALSQLGLVSKFIGMLTDSRSFLSYTRHDYFRRILCNMFGTLIEDGEYPADIDFVGEIVKDICYNNAIAYFTK
ncbi:glucuronate isomerase [Ruminococcus albus]|uniref:Uronate isomerase n=1 Tax=Ruminococcus albus (strain ATCC 27210 / DSM 20455 / JCM 14654 / NCDO 2250 / 7) TaxID=697329 RepID=E6UC39_RUMA7|nr:glucuronate isomerase [Ruminococcus albus]ADU22661.1 Glucuronate isomerase [Ruminococcus albus 7 = DSM 20455]